MDFGLSEEQELLQDTVRGFVKGECPVTRLREVYDAGGFDPALWKGLAELGCAGLALPEAHGGAGLELLECALVAEALGGGAFPSPFLGHTLAGLAIAHGGSDAQKQRWLPALASGEAIGTVAFGERGDRWLPGDWTAALAGGRVSGAKVFVPHAERAALTIVGTAGGGLALVPGGTSGLRCEPIDAFDRSQGVVALALDGAAAEALPGGRAAAERVVDAGLVLLAADAFGAAWRMIELARDYVSVRKQFGAPLAQFQAVKHQLANLVTDTEPCRGLWWFAAHAWDHRREEAAKAAAIAKAHVTDVAMDVGRGAFELHGGIGFTWECDLQFWYKRATFDRHFLGTPDVHLDRNADLGGW
ncbi:MAG TPA: acyl-CoA dehydrogenase family protein [Myxococcota bacterium]|nr:acyl-CoA dehydrogenase family protein [Myxococcota bacterium]